MANQENQGQGREQNRSNNPGKFKPDDQRTREAGKKGGESSRGGGRRSE
jgi:general stress protein YciG